MVDLVSFDYYPKDPNKNIILIMQLFVYILSLNFWLHQPLYEEQMHTLQYNPDGSNLEMKKVWDVNFEQWSWQCPVGQ